MSPGKSSLTVSAQSSNTDAANVIGTIESDKPAAVVAEPVKDY